MYIILNKVSKQVLFVALRLTQDTFRAQTKWITLHINFEYVAYNQLVIQGSKFVRNLSIIFSKYTV